MAKDKKKKSKKFLVLLVALLLVLIYAVSLVTDFCGGSGGARQQITVPAGASTEQIASLLGEAGLVRHELWFRLFSKLGGHDGQYLQGVFLVPEGAGYGKIFDILKNPPVPQDVVKVTIPEGFELRQIADKLEEAGLIDREAFYQEVENGVFDYAFLKGLPKRENRLEGYLFPDTYQFSKQEGERAIIEKMLARFDEVYNETYRLRAKELNMTDDEVITLASVIEREAQGDADRKKVAGVFANRLKNAQYPYLESCATVQYILKERKAVLTVADTKIDSPYNTYQNPGLPAGPIASPGQKSIEAALYPEQHDYLFFVMDSSGKHRFAKTFSEHQQNMNR